MELFKKLFQKGDDGQNQSGQEQTGQNPDGSEQEPGTEEEVTVGTKIKVVAALVVVGFAAYVAYWIQEPVEVRTDLLGSGSSMQSMGSTQSATQAATQSMTQMTGTTQEVSIINFAFEPAVLNAEKGTTVVWTNKDTVPHSVVGDNFASPTLNPGDSFTYTFNSEGSFAYKCTFHPQMKGYVIIAVTGGETQAAPGTNDQILSGFGAGSSLSLGGTATPPAPETQTTQQPSEVAPPEQAPTQAPAETTPPAAPEQIYQSNAAAPAAELHNAAQSLNASLGNLGNVAANSAQGSTSLSAAQLAAQQQQQAIAAQQAAQEQAMAAAQLNNTKSMHKGKLASSGPEDYVYAGMFGLILFLNRRKLRKLRKSPR